MSRTTVRSRAERDALEREQEEEEGEEEEEEESSEVRRTAKVGGRDERRERPRRTGFGRAVAVGMFLSIITIMPLTITALFLVRPGKILPGDGMAQGVLLGLASCLVLALAFGAVATRPSPRPDDE